LAGEADILLKLLGAVSRRTAYDLMSFIEDPEAEIEAFEAERQENMALTGLFDKRDDGRDDEREDDDTERAEDE